MSKSLVYINEIRARMTFPEPARDKKLLWLEVVPTFLLMKLSVAVDETIDALWQRRFPEFSSKRFHFDEKLKILAALHELDLTAFTNLRRLRNECAHTLTGRASWKDYEKHFWDLADFVSDLQRKYSIKLTLKRSKKRQR